jgi:uncharacterized protein (DUF302 family)
MSTITVAHKKYSSDASFEDFTRRFESLCGLHDARAYTALLADREKVKTAEKVIAGQAGPSGFMIFAVYDHGALLNIKNASRKAKQYVVGNPLIAARMTEHDIRAGLYAPLRVLVYEDADSKLQVEYDLPSTLFGQFHNSKVDDVARALDAKLGSLIHKSSLKALGIGPRVPRARSRSLRRRSARP